MGNLCKKSDKEDQDKSDISSNPKYESKLTNNQVTSSVNQNKYRTPYHNSKLDNMKIIPQSNNDSSNIGTICHNCNRRFRDEDLIVHYQICFNRQSSINQQVNQVINFINSNSEILASQINNDSNPFVPDNLNEYIDWELKKNPNTGINIWYNKGVVTPSGK